MLSTCNHDGVAEKAILAIPQVVASLLPAVIEMFCKAALVADHPTMACEHGCGIPTLVVDSPGLARFGQITDAATLYSRHYGSHNDRGKKNLRRG